MLRRTTIIIAFAVVALAVCACFIAAALPFAAVRESLDSLAGDGSADPYTPQLHARLRIYFACLGIAGLAGAAWLIVETRRGKLGRSFLGRLGGDIRQLGADTLGCLRAHIGTVIALIFIGLLTRAPYLDQPIRYDEAHSFVNYANRPAYVTLSTYKEPNNHVFHNLCMHVVTRMFGDAEWVIRLPALVAGVLMIPATYALGHLWAGRGAGWLAALAAAASSPLIGYSVNARGYALVCLIAVCLFLLGHDNLRRPNRAVWGAMAVLAAIGFWTVPTMLYPYALLLVWLVAMHTLRSRTTARGWRRRFFVFVASTVGLSLLVYSPILLVEGPAALVGNRLIVSPDWRGFLGQLPASLTETGRLLFRDLPIPAMALLVIGWFTALHPSRIRQNPAPALLLLSSGVCVLLVLIQRVVPPPRIWLFLLPLILPSAIYGVMSLVSTVRPVHRAATLLTIGLLLVVWPLINLIRHDSIRQSQEGGTCPDAEPAIVWLKSRLLPREPIVAITPCSAPLVYYALRHGLSLEHFGWPGGPDTRNDTAIVVTNPAWDRNESPEDVLRALQLEASYSGRRYERLKAFPSVELYRATGREHSQ